MFEFYVLSLLYNTNTLRNILMMLGTNVEQDKMLSTRMTTVAGDIFFFFFFFFFLLAFLFFFKKTFSSFFFSLSVLDFFKCLRLIYNLFHTYNSDTRCWKLLKKEIFFTTFVKKIRFLPQKESNKIRFKLIFLLTENII